MSDAARVWQLLEEALDSGLTPEDVCAQSRELLPEVRDRWERCRRLDAELNEFFPSVGPDGVENVAGTDGPQRAVAELPSIPGYAVEAVLGYGGVGVVYRARHLRLQRPVALKMLLSGVYAGPVERARFLREAQAVGGLRHPHVVQIHDAGEYDGRPYFTMELVEGGSLADRLGGVPRTAADSAELVGAIADAIEAAHRAGIVHRDLKPANVLLTADGTPKVSDFGLALQAGTREDAGAVLTQAGARMGTPSYMAPEQAAGRRNEVGPATDVYALGAILYEMLTGRPPFRGESAAETERQVIAHEPVAPSRLNARVPRDLETICLKCLRKEPERRYSSAGALADDLSRFREGRPIEARPPSLAGRMWRWSRREPTKAALVATALALAAMAIGGGFWLQREQALARAQTARQEGRTWQAVEAALEQAALLQEQGRWPEARAALQAAPSLMGASAPPALQERLRQARADTDMVIELEETRLRLSQTRASRAVISPSLDRLYGAAFRNYGIDVAILEPAEGAARVRRSAIRQTLLAFLHDWLYWVPDKERGKLRAMVELADDDPWRRSFRSALASKDDTALKALACAPEAEGQPAVVLSGLGGTLLVGGHRDEAWVLLRGAQRRHPGDFWINYLLGRFLEQERPQEAVGYYRAAVAVRPGSDQAYALVGQALRETGDSGESAAALRKALALNPNQANLQDLARVLAPQGRLEEARVIWEQILKGDPPDRESWHGYAQLCLFLGNEPAYRWARAALLDHFGENPRDWVVAERTSVSCLLMPASGDESRRIAALAKRAVVLSGFPQKDNTYVGFVAGLSEYRQGRPGPAIPLLRNSAEKLPERAGPRLVLAMAQFRTGSEAEARKTLATALRTYNWQASADETLWVSHVFRREAEALILPSLPTFLRPDHQMAKDDERLAFVEICQSKGLNRTAARLFADAFAADPSLADELSAQCLDHAAREARPDDRAKVLQSEHRYLAARCAALAGRGLGNDTSDVSDVERTRWRGLARAWLAADLARLIRTPCDGSEQSPDLKKQMLALWLADQDLAGLREADALNTLPRDERETWIALWKQIDDVLARTSDTKSSN